MKNNKPNIDNLYPIKQAKDMNDEEFARWWALMEALDTIFTHADKYSIDIDDINLSTKKILDEYVTPISGDILHDIKTARNCDEDFTKTVIKL
jgi:hypothetical protein